VKQGLCICGLLNLPPPKTEACCDDQRDTNPHDWPFEPRLGLIFT
jgi:hypothetical protein